MHDAEKQVQSLKWRIPQNTTLYIKQRQDSAIVFHSKSGETHQLNDIGIAALLIIQQHPVSLNDLADQINNLYEVETPSELTVRLQRLVKDFEILGLIEPFKE